MATHKLTDGWDVVCRIEESYRISLMDDWHRMLSEDSSPPRLPIDLQRRCNSLISTIDHLLGRQEVLSDEKLSSCLAEHRVWLEKMSPPCRLMRLPAELREQIFALAVTERVVVSGELVWIGAPPRAVRVLQQRPIRMDRLNKPAPPGMCASL